MMKDLRPVWMSEDNDLLRRLLLEYKYRSSSIKEAIDKIDLIKNLKRGYISDSHIKKILIPYLVRSFIPDKYRSAWNTNSRKRELVILQQTIMYILFKLKVGGNRSIARVGELVRNKDHSTVSHAVKAVQNLLDTDLKYHHYFTSVFNEIYYFNKRNISYYEKYK